MSSRERGARPAPLPRGSARAAIRRAAHGFMRHRGVDAAAALTFFTSLAIFPALLVLVSMFALFDDRNRAAQNLAAIVGTVLPAATTADIDGGLRELLTLHNPLLAIAAGTVLLVWTVSGYATAFGRALDGVYEAEEGRPFWVFRARMLLVAVALIVLDTGIVAILLGTPSVVADIVGHDVAGTVLATVWDVGRWPLLLVLLVLAIAVLYTYTPIVRHIRLRWASVGSLAAIVLWSVATAGFALYLSVAGHYGALYGSLGGVLIALLWAYLTNTAFIAGAELDAEFVRLRQLARGEPAEEHVRLPVRDTRRRTTIARQREEDVAAAHRIRTGVDEPGRDSGDS
jgi:membrane protein